MKTIIPLCFFLFLVIAAGFSIYSLFGSSTEAQLESFLNFDTTFSDNKSEISFKDRIRTLIDLPEKTVTSTVKNDFGDITLEEIPEDPAKTAKVKPPGVTTEKKPVILKNGDTFEKSWEDIFKEERGNAGKDKKEFEGDDWAKAFDQKSEGDTKPRSPNSGKDKERPDANTIKVEDFAGKDVWPSSTFGEAEFSEDEVWSSLYKKIEEGAEQDSQRGTEGLPETKDSGESEPLPVVPEEGANPFFDDEW